MKTLIIGLGNPILGDDGVGWRAVEQVAARLPEQSDLEFDYVSLGGLSLMERLTGYARVILVDAIYTGTKPIGTVSTFTLADLPDLSAGHTASAHDTSLRNALNIGRSMDIPLPLDNDVLIVAIEAENVYEFSEKLSPLVETALPKAVKVIEALL
ncbi:MAG: hydrogenase maturation protease [Anaerolineales bacterium]|nr:hydrogenase maturation protease [Anaerolineales bacterium]